MLLKTRLTGPVLRADRKESEESVEVFGLNLRS